MTGAQEAHADKRLLKGLLRSGAALHLGEEPVRWREPAARLVLDTYLSQQSIARGPANIERALCVGRGRLKYAPRFLFFASLGVDGRAIERGRDGARGVVPERRHFAIESSGINGDGRLDHVLLEALK